MQKWRRKRTLTVKSWTEVLEGVAIVWSKRVKNEAISEERELIGETKRVREENCVICKRICLESWLNRVLESRDEEDKDRTLKNKFLVRRERIDEEQNMEDERKWKMGLNIYNYKWTPRVLSELWKTRDTWELIPSPRSCFAGGISSNLRFEFLGVQKFWFSFSLLLLITSLSLKLSKLTLPIYI